MKKCFYKGCPEKGLFAAGWRVRGPLEPGGPTDRIQPGETGTLGRACHEHHSVLTGRARLLAVTDSTADVEWGGLIETVIKLPTTSEATKAEAEVILEQARAAAEHLAAYIKVIEKRANPVALKLVNQSKRGK